MEKKDYELKTSVCYDDPIVYDEHMCFKIHIEDYEKYTNKFYLNIELEKTDLVFVDCLCANMIKSIILKINDIEIMHNTGLELDAINRFLIYNLIPNLNNYDNYICYHKKTIRNFPIHVDKNLMNYCKSCEIQICLHNSTKISNNTCEQINYVKSIKIFYYVETEENLNNYYVLK